MALVMESEAEGKGIHQLKHAKLPKPHYHYTHRWQDNS
jgi:hypothetical protein